MSNPGKRAANIKILRALAVRRWRHRNSSRGVSSSRPRTLSAALLAAAAASGPQPLSTLLALLTPPVTPCPNCRRQVFTAGVVISRNFGEYLFVG